MILTSTRTVLSQRRRPGAEDSGALLLTPLERLERLAALGPAPRTPWLRDHGVLAPHAAWRPLIVPEPASAQTAEVAPGEDDPPIAARRIPWARLLRRVFAVEVWTCARWGGRRRVVAVPEAGPPGASRRAGCGPRSGRRRLAGLARPVHAAGRPATGPLRAPLGVCYAPLTRGLPPGEGARGLGCLRRGR